MTTGEVRLPYIGGHTALVELGGLRVLTAPAFHNLDRAAVLVARAARVRWSVAGQPRMRPVR